MSAFCRLAIQASRSLARVATNPRPTRPTSGRACARANTPSSGRAPTSCAWPRPAISRHSRPLYRRTWSASRPRARPAALAGSTPWGSAPAEDLPTRRHHGAPGRQDAHHRSLLATTVGLRGAAAHQDVVLLAGPNLTATGIDALNMWAFEGSTGKLLGSKRLPEYTNLRRGIVVRTTSTWPCARQERSTVSAARS